MTTSKDNPTFRDGYGDKVREVATAISRAVPDDTTLSHLASALGIVLFTRIGDACDGTAEYDKNTDAAMAALQGSVDTVRNFLLKSGALRDDGV